MAPKKPTSTQSTTLQTMGMDVIKQYPGPLTVSRAVKLAVKRWTSRLPGKHFPQPAADRQGAQQLEYLCLRPTEEAIIARATC